MKLTAASKVLAHALEIAGLAVNSKATGIDSQYVLATADKLLGCVTLEAQMQGLGVRIVMNVEVERAGQAMLGPNVGKLCATHNGIATIEDDGRHQRVSAGVVARFGSRSPVDHPGAGETKALGSKLGDRMLHGLATVAYAAADDPSKAISGVCVFADEPTGVVKMFATNSYRMAAVDGDKKVGDAQPILVPGATLGRIAKLVTSDSDKVEMGYDDEKLYLRITPQDEHSVITRIDAVVALLAHRYPDFNPYVSIKREPVGVLSDGAALLNALNKARIIMGDPALGITIQGDGQRVRLWGRSQDGESFSTSLPVSEGAEFAITVRLSYLIDALSEISGRLQFGFASATRPLFLTNGKPGTFHGLMPMNLLLPPPEDGSEDDEDLGDLDEADLDEEAADDEDEEDDTWDDDE